MLSRSVISVLVLLLCLTGCGTRYYVKPVKDTVSEEQPDEVRAEAWLFNTRVWRDGKPTTIRLEIYLTDSITALSGRGYLGKGAMKGTIKDDSLFVYFPASNEYVRESTSSLLDAGDCEGKAPYVDILALLTQLPDSIDDLYEVQMTTNYTDPEKPTYVLYAKDCKWKLNLQYDYRKNGWRMKSFEFNSGNGTRIKAWRRTYEQRAEVPVKRFHVQLKPEAIRIIP
ncbi:MAG: hypothetical protein U9N55_01115 [candidate division Zixibacteria bacterium]|nr:hypothetical protein [candidate division Zixibacteria bacterium]